MTRGEKRLNAACLELLVFEERRMNADKRTEICAHRACECEIGPDSIERNKHRYCSRGCANGVGCDHPDCLCSASDDIDIGVRHAGRTPNEGNWHMERRHRDTAHEAVDELSAGERAEKARALREKEITRARDAEREGKSQWKE
jgi:hypothetical protein